jgi:hypothetical protein
MTNILEKIMTIQTIMLPFLIFQTYKNTIIIKECPSFILATPLIMFLPDCGWKGEHLNPNLDMLWSWHCHDDMS